MSLDPDSYALKRARARELERARRARREEWRAFAWLCVAAIGFAICLFGLWLIHPGLLLVVGGFVIGATAWNAIE